MPTLSDQEVLDSYRRAANDPNPTPAEMELAVRHAERLASHPAMTRLKVQRERVMRSLGLTD